MQRLSVCFVGGGGSKFRAKASAPSAHLLLQLHEETKRSKGMELPEHFRKHSGIITKLVSTIFWLQFQRVAVAPSPPPHHPPALWVSLPVVRLKLVMGITGLHLTGSEPSPSPAGPFSSPLLQQDLRARREGGGRAERRRETKNRTVAQEQDFLDPQWIPSLLTTIRGFGIPSPKGATAVVRLAQHIRAAVLLQGESGSGLFVAHTGGWGSFGQLFVKVNAAVQPSGFNPFVGGSSSRSSVKDDHANRSAPRRVGRFKPVCLQRQLGLTQKPATKSGEVL
ncbi:hypothetical protein Q8A73_016739 [Channa argus]|nr:hypothetical protein Q8A73_016739 [Channa argus]